MFGSVHAYFLENSRKAYPKSLIGSVHFVKDIKTEATNQMQLRELVSNTVRNHDAAKLSACPNAYFLENSPKVYPKSASNLHLPFSTPKHSSRAQNTPASLSLH